MDFAFIMPEKNFDFNLWEKFCLKCEIIFKERLKSGSKYALKAFLEKKDSLDIGNKILR